MFGDLVPYKECDSEGEQAPKSKDILIRLSPWSSTSTLDFSLYCISYISLRELPYLASQAGPGDQHSTYCFPKDLGHINI